MKDYELVIEEQQPPCGGKMPTRCQILTVTTDDPVQYVRDREKDPVGELDIYTDQNGDLVVKLDHNREWIKYIFTEI